jgi:hypothetical protein
MPHRSRPLPALHRWKSPARRGAVGLLLLGLALTAAAQATLTGRFQGDGRACYGRLTVTPKSLHWTSSFARCGPAPYTLIEQRLQGEHPRAVFKMGAAGRHCDFAIVELARYNEWFWSVKGYPSTEAYEKREQPGWKDMTVLLCGMRKD